MKDRFAGLILIATVLLRALLSSTSGPAEAAGKHSDHSAMSLV